MKTTILLDDTLYERLVREAVRRYGSAKNISAALNDILRERLAPSRSMFGKLDRFPLDDLRDEHDRLA